MIGAQPEWHLELERSFVQPEVAYAYEKAQRACARCEWDVRGGEDFVVSDKPHSERSVRGV